MFCKNYHEIYNRASQKRLALVEHVSLKFGHLEASWRDNHSWDSIQANTKALQKHLEPESVGCLRVMTASVFSKAPWRAAYLFDWGKARLKEILESNFDRIGFSMAIRHWR